MSDQYSQGSNTATDSYYYVQPKTTAGSAVFTAPPNGTFNTQTGA